MELHLHENYYEIAEKYYIKRNYHEALNYFQKSCSIKESNDSLNYMGCCYIYLGDNSAAIKLFKKVIEKSPNWERPYFNIGRVYLQNGDMVKSLEYFEKALSLNHYNEDSYFYLGVYYYRLEEYDEAKQYHEKSLQLNYQQSETHLCLGKCYYHLKNYEKAIEEFDSAYIHDNYCYDAIYNKGQTYLKMRNYEEAIVFLYEYNKFQLNDIENLFDIAFCYFRIEELDNASEWLNKILQINPDHEDANSLLAHIKHEQTK